MCRCRELRERVVFLEEALSEAEWDLRYRSMLASNPPDSPDRRIQLMVASDLARARCGFLSNRKTEIAAIAAAPADAGAGETE